MFSLKPLTRFHARRLVFISVSLMFLSGCPWFGSDGDNNEPGETGVGNVELRFSAVDGKGRPVTGLALSSPNMEIHSVKVDAPYSRVSVKPHETDSILKVEKPGYLDGIVFFEGIKADYTKQVTLIERAPPITADADRGGRYTGQSGASVEFPPGSLRMPDGSQVTGNVELYITPIDTSDPILSQGFPGSFYGAPDTGTTQDDQYQLLSYGVVDVTFEQNGEKLQLADNQTATLTLPLYATKDIAGNDLTESNTIPLWILDEESGIWILQSQGAVIKDASTPNGLALQATTSHFSSFNCDINPPGLIRGAGSGGGRPEFVTVNVNVLGAEPGKTYMYQQGVAFPGGPVQRTTRQFIYDGNNINYRTLKGLYVNARLTDVKDTTITDFDRGAAFSDPLLLSLKLTDAPPNFTTTALRVEPNFTQGGSGYAITSNTVYVGASFHGTDGVRFESDFINTPLILGSGIYHEVEYKPGDPSPGLVNMIATNEFGTTEHGELVTYVDSHPPKIGYIWLESSANPAQFKLRWENTEGADFVGVAFMDESTPPVETYLDSMLLDDNTNRSNEMNLLHSQLSGDGYIKVTFENNYGREHVLLRVSQSCPPGSELCSGT